MNDIQRAAPQEHDSRLRPSGVLWSLTTHAAGICIPLIVMISMDSHPLMDALLAAALAGVAAVSTLTIWKNRRARQARRIIDHGATQKQVRELEERLANLEVITRFERRLSESQSMGVLSQPAPPTTTPLRHE